MSWIVRLLPLVLAIFLALLTYPYFVHRKSIPTSQPPATYPCSNLCPCLGQYQYVLSLDGSDTGICVNACNEAFDPENPGQFDYYYSTATPLTCNVFTVRFKNDKPWILDPKTNTIYQFQEGARCMVGGCQAKPNSSCIGYLSTSKLQSNVC